MFALLITHIKSPIVEESAEFGGFFIFDKVAD